MDSIKTKITVYIVLSLILISVLTTSTPAQENYLDDMWMDDNEFFFDLFYNHGNVMLIIDPATGEIIYANLAAFEYYGYPDLDDMNIQRINTLTPVQVQEEMERASRLDNNFFQFRHLLADGSIRDVEVYSYPIEINGKTLLFSIIIDVTDKIQAEREVETRNNIIFSLIATALAAMAIMIIFLIKNINRRKKAEAYDHHIKKVLMGISNVSQMIVKESDPSKLIEKACKKLTDNLGYSNSCIVMFDDSGNVSSVTSSGDNDMAADLKRDVLNARFDTWINTALEADDVVIAGGHAAEPIECPLRIDHLDNADMFIPLCYKEKTYGIIAASIPQEYAYTDEEKILFKELADNLGFALYNIEMENKRKQAERKLKERESFIETVLNNLPIGIAVNSVDPDVNFEYMNDNFPRIYRTTREKLTSSDSFWNVVYEDPEFRESLKKKVIEDCASGDPVRMQWSEIPIVRKGEETSYVTARNIPIPDTELMISTVWDVTRDKKLKEMQQKEILLKEVHHRVKNNLQVIASLLNMQSRNFDDEKVKGAFRDSQNRVRSMSLAHEKLYGSSELSNIEISDYIKSLEHYVLQSYNTYAKDIELENDLDTAYLGIDIVVPLGLILTELMTNSFKHAFIDRKEGMISVTFRSFEDEYLLKISDNGIGISDEFDVESSKSLGLKIVNMLVQQLQGSLSLNSSNGTDYVIRFRKS